MSVSAPSSVTNTSPCWNGFIVPASTLTYGSNLRSVTRQPRLLSSRPSDAEVMPFPSADVTPPVTKMYLVPCCVIGRVPSPPAGAGVPSSFTPPQLRPEHGVKALAAETDEAGPVRRPAAAALPQDPPARRRCRLRR